MLLIGFLISSLSLVAIPLASGETVTGLKIISPTNQIPASVQPGGTVNIIYQINVSRTDQIVLIQVTILKGSTTVGSSVVLKILPPSNSFSETTSYTIPADTTPGTYDVRVRAKQPVGEGKWQQEVMEQNAVIVQTPSVDTSLTLSITPSSVVVGSNGPVTFTATLIRADTNTGVAGATISFTVDGTPVRSATTDGNGVATLNYNPSGLTPGFHTVQASFAGQTIGGITFNPSSDTQTLQVIYNFIGFLPPLEAEGTPSGTFKAGSTIPVKFQLTDYYGSYISNAIANIYVDSSYIGDFRYDLTNNQYIFNLSTEGMSTGAHKIMVTLDDKTTHSTTITLK
jgi:hypothetical protein